MKCKFEIGQMVACIAPEGLELDPTEPPSHLEVGRIYTISGFCPEEHEVVGVFLEELQANLPPGSAWCNCFCSTRFRPLRTTDISQLHELVAPKPKPVKENV